MAVNYNLLSWNVQRLNDGVKRVALFSALQSYPNATVCLQETHFQSNTLLLLRHLGFLTPFHSIHTAYSRGVSILISNIVPFHLIQCQADPQGRYVFLLCKIAGVECIIANMYIPPPLSSECLSCLAQFMAAQSNVPIWVLGDFNNLLDKSKNKFVPNGDRPMGPAGSTSFARLVLELGLCDVWRTRHPEEKCYSFYSTSHRGLSHIDLCLNNSMALSMVNPVEYLPINISDHSLLRVQISILGTSGTKLWNFNPFWFNLFPAVDTLFLEIQTFLHHNRGLAKLGVVWDALKAYMRGLIIRQISNIKTATKEWGTLVLSEAKKAEEHYVMNPSLALERSWLAAQSMHQQVSCSRNI